MATVPDTSTRHEDASIQRSGDLPLLPLLSVVVPVFNEQALLEKHLAKIVAYLRAIEIEFRWELIIVNDGSIDNTTKITNEFAEGQPNVVVLHHPKNFGLGQAMRFGFNNTRGDIVVTMDIDLSYDVEHIGELIRSIRDRNAKIALASPYMRGGSIRNVPWLRRNLSVWGNRFLSFFARGHFSTLTSMMRAYDGNFIRSVNLRSMGMDIMPETVNKAMILGGSIVEIPGRLDWGPQREYSESRISSMQIVRHIFATILAGFIFRPFLFFIIPGLAIAAFSLYVNFWMIVHYFDELRDLRTVSESAGWTDAFAAAYQSHPHTFIFGLLTAMLSVQLIGLGILAVQSKRYFDELFDLGSQATRMVYRLPKR
jgi:glycosyltransferase involved in cell wall biosynthesis